MLRTASPRFDPAVEDDALRFAVRARALGTALQRPRLVVPGDARGGRCVTCLTDLSVLDPGC